MEPAAPEQEVEYPLRLGASFTSVAPAQLYTLRCTTPTRTPLRLGKVRRTIGATGRAPSCAA